MLRPTDAREKTPVEFSAISDTDCLARDHTAVVLRRGGEAGDHQLQVFQTGEGRPLLREDFRSRQGLGMQLRQVQADPVQRSDLRQVQGRGDPGQGAPRETRAT